MIIVLKAGATDTQIDEVAARVRTLGYAPHMIRGEIRTVIGAVGDERGKEDLLSLENFECVAHGLLLAQFGLPTRQLPVGGERMAVEGGDQPRQALEIVHRPELVDVGKHRLVAL